MPPPGVVLNPAPPPIGEQLLAFVEAPADAPAAHFDIRYWFEPVEDGSFKVVCRVEVRTNIEEAPVASADITLPRTYPAASADAAVGDLVNQIVMDMTGAAAVAALVMPGMPAFPLPFKPLVDRVTAAGTNTFSG